MKSLMILLLTMGGCISTYPSPTTLSICWDADGRAHYPNDKYADTNTNCLAEKFVWSKRVKQVYFNDGGEYGSYKVSFYEAINFWNSEIGQQVFSVSNNSYDADIVVGFSDFSQPFGSIDHPAASTRHLRILGFTRAEITIKSFMDTRQMYLTIAHELGHAGFGLAHDHHGIMYPYIADAEGDVTKGEYGQDMNGNWGMSGGIRMLFWPVLENDKQAIRAMLRD